MNNMEKFEYLAYMFNVRTNGKKFENFVVNAIYSKIGNNELVPVTQQYVRNPKDRRKYYLLDLYFPQINYGIEVDERHHLSDDNMQLDKIREEDICSAISCEEGRIEIFKVVYNGDQKLSIMQSYDEICMQIDREVEIINSRIAKIEKVNGEKIKWQSNEEMKNEIMKRGTFCISDKVEYKGITDIYNITGHHAKQLRRCFYRLNINYYLWVPTLAVKSDDGNVECSNNYENYLTEDGTRIIEIDKKDRWKEKDLNEEEFKKGSKRVVFMKLRDKFGKRCVRFVGVYEALRIDSASHQKQRLYRRVSDTIQIKDLYPDNK